MIMPKISQNTADLGESGFEWACRHRVAAQMQSKAANV